MVANDSWPNALVNMYGSHRYIYNEAQLWVSDMLSGMVLHEKLLIHGKKKILFLNANMNIYIHTWLICAWLDGTWGSLVMSNEWEVHPLSPLGSCLCFSTLDVSVRAGEGAKTNCDNYYCVGVCNHLCHHNLKYSFQSVLSCSVEWDSYYWKENCLKCVWKHKFETHGSKVRKRFCGFQLNQAGKFTMKRFFFFTRYILNLI